MCVLGCVSWRGLQVTNSSPARVEEGQVQRGLSPGWERGRKALSFLHLEEAAEEAVSEEGQRGPCSCFLVWLCPSTGTPCPLPTSGSPQSTISTGPEVPSCHLKDGWCPVSFTRAITSPHQVTPTPCLSFLSYKTEILEVPASGL